MVQLPTCQTLKVRTPDDARVIFHAVCERRLRMVTRRLDTDERRAISSGCIYVWEERGTTAENSGLGIERWTDSIQWGPSRVRDEFLFYQERRTPAPDGTSDSDAGMSTMRPAHFRPPLIKQTYSVYVETPSGRRKWHLIAYFTQDTVDELFTISNHPTYTFLRTLKVPTGMYASARSARRRPQPPSPTDSEPNERDMYGPPTLPPLEFLQTNPPRPRHVLDQMAINSLPIYEILSGKFSYRCSGY